MHYFNMYYCFCLDLHIEHVMFIGRISLEVIPVTQIVNQNNVKIVLGCLFNKFTIWFAFYILLYMEI